MYFRRIILSALLVGALAGVMATAVQLWQTVPIIQSAEVFEGVSAPAASVHDHAAQNQGAHAHPADAWAPADGLERSGFTLASNILTAIGFALVVLVAMVLSLPSDNSKKLGWLHGLLWAAAGYVTFFVAPALGLPPEVPGSAAAPLEERQIWWISTVVCTAAGLGILAFGKSPWRWAGLALLIVPHVLGAPHLHGGLFADKPAEVAVQLESLTQQFISATAIANAALWLTLGLASVWTVRRFVSPSN